jgi:hypothetical protein
MKTLKACFVAGLVLAVVVPSLAATYISDFPCTKQTWLGRALYDSNTNYSSRKFGRVAKGEMDFNIQDFDRAAMLTYIQNFYTAAGITISSDPTIGAAQLQGTGTGTNRAVTMLWEQTAYDSWEESGAPYPPTVFGHTFWPGVRLSAGQNWDEATATFNNAAGLGNPWHDALGNAIANIYVTKYNTHANMVLNATSQTWGQAAELGGGADYYVYDITRPWKLDNSVAYAAIKNPAAVGFDMVHDMYSQPWALQTDGTYLEDDCVGSIYGRLHGLTEFRPFLEVVVNTQYIGTGAPPTQTYWPADFNHGPLDTSKSPVQHGKVDFADYLILEANFGKSGMTNGQGDADGNGKVDFADYLILEAQFGKTTPEPATIGLLVLGGLGLLRRRAAK